MFKKKWGIKKRGQICHRRFFINLVNPVTLCDWGMLPEAQLRAQVSRGLQYHNIGSDGVDEFY